MRPGHALRVLRPLGTCYPIEAKEEVLMVGGGVGTPPMLLTAKAYQDLAQKFMLY